MNWNAVKASTFWNVCFEPPVQNTEPGRGPVKLRAADRGSSKLMSWGVGILFMGEALKPYAY